MYIFLYNTALINSSRIIIIKSCIVFELTSLYRSLLNLEKQHACICIYDDTHKDDMTMALDVIKLSQVQQ